MKKIITLCLAVIISQLILFSQDWPQFAGPNNDLTPGYGDNVPTVNSFNNARLKWITEINTYPGRSQARRKRCDALIEEWLPSGNGGGPIIYKGYLYKYQLEPYASEDYPFDHFGPVVYDSLWCVSDGDVFAATGKSYWWQHNLELWYNKGVDVIYCFDIETGKLVWRKVMPGFVIYPWDDLTKEYVGNYTAAAAFDKVFFKGGFGSIYALNYLTGEVEWQKIAPPLSSTTMVIWQRGEGTMQIIGDKLVTSSAGSNKGTTMSIYDAATGTLLSKTPSEMMAPDSYNSVYKESGKNYIVLANGTYDGGDFALYNIDDGQLMWSSKALGDTFGHNIHGIPFIYKDTVLIAGKRPPNSDWAGRICAYKISSTGYTKLWELGDTIAFSNNEKCQYKNGMVIIRFSSSDNVLSDKYTGKLVTLRLKDGKLMGTFNWRAYYDGMDNAGAMEIYDDKLFFLSDGSHATALSVAMFDISDPANIINLGSLNEPEEPSVGYEYGMRYPVADGKLYFVGKTNIYCYDLSIPANDIKANLTGLRKPAVYFPGDDVTFGVQATSASGITKAEFYSDGIKIGEDNSAPFEYTINNIADTRQTVKARVTNGNAETAWTESITIRSLRPAYMVFPPTGYHYFMDKDAEMGFIPVVYDREGIRFPFLFDYNNFTYAAKKHVIDSNGRYHATTYGNDTVVATLHYNGQTMVDSVFVHIKVTNRSSQTITTNEPDFFFSAKPFHLLTATASSGLEVEYTLISGDVDLNKDTIFPKSAGNVIIKVTQRGDAYYEAAPEVYDTFTIRKDVDFMQININTGNTLLNISDLAGVEPYKSAYWVNTGENDLAAGEVYDNQGFATQVTVTLPTNTSRGDAAAPETTGDHKMLKTYDRAWDNYKLNIGNIPSSFTSNGYTVIAYWNTHTTGNRYSNITINGVTKVIYDNSSSFDGVLSESTATTPAAAVLGNEYVVFTGLTDPNLVINFTSTGGSSQVGASGIQIIATGNLPPQLSQYITFNSLADKNYNDPDFILTATASSGLGVSYELVSGPATISGDTVKLTGENGTVVIKAMQDGNTTYEAALPVERSFVVSGAPKKSQTIYFNPIPDKYINDGAFNVLASASSGLPVTIIVKSGPAIISGNTVSLTGLTGTVVLLASQAGDLNYDSAASVEQSFQVLDVPTLLERNETGEIMVYPNPVEDVFDRLSEAHLQWFLR